MKRQFIWMMTDSTRYDMLGAYGNPAMKTPNLDKMAVDGVRFERAYTTQPVCGPARSSLFTGMFPHTNGGVTNCVPLGADVKTLGQRLAKEGIRAAYIGKYHLDGGDYFGYGECPDGWDREYWYDMRNYLEEMTDEERVFSRNSENAGGNLSETFTYGYRATERALRFLSAHRDEDFLLVLSLDEPHDPGLCPEPYASMYQGYEWPRTAAHYDTLAGKPYLQHLWARGNDAIDRESVHVHADRFLGCNSFADALLGRVIDRAAQETPDALLMYTSDHGDAMAQHCLFAKGPSIYEGIARIPLIFKGGARGRVISQVASHIDIPATVMDAMGLPVPKTFQGRSILAGIYDPSRYEEAPAFVEFTRYEVDHDGFGGFQPMRAIVDGSMKLAIHLLDPIDELYDTEKDPEEVHNLINDPDYRAVRDALHEKLLAWMNDTRDPFRGYQWRARPWRTDAVPSWDGDGMTRQRETEPGEKRQLDYMTGLEMSGAVRKKG